jgi:hypothetical protein
MIADGYELVHNPLRVEISAPNKLPLLCIKEKKTLSLSAAAPDQLYVNLFLNCRFFMLP